MSEAGPLGIGAGWFLGGGDAVGHRELLSYLFFDEQYCAASSELGGRTAAAALSRGWEQ